MQKFKQGLFCLTMESCRSVIYISLPDLRFIGRCCYRPFLKLFQVKVINNRGDRAPHGWSVANLYMEEFEERAIATVSYKPKIWKRYEDDTFTILGKDYVDGFLQHLNSQPPTIRFTMEIEKDNTVPFLDTSVSRDSNGLLTTRVYRKPTHTDQYLAYDSHHPQSVKRGIVVSIRPSQTPHIKTISYL